MCTLCRTTRCIVQLYVALINLVFQEKCDSVGKVQNDSLIIEYYVPKGKHVALVHVQQVLWLPDVLGLLCTQNKVVTPNSLDPNGRAL